MHKIDALNINQSILNHWVFLIIVETAVGLVLCCGVGIAQCFLNLLYYIIW